MSSHPAGVKKRASDSGIVSGVPANAFRSRLNFELTFDELTMEVARQRSFLKTLGAESSPAASVSVTAATT